MKILFVTSYAPSLVGFRFSLFKHLVSIGHEVVCASPGLKSDHIRALDLINVRSISLSLSRHGASPFEAVRSFLDCIRLLKIVSPDCVFSYFLKPNIFTSAAAKFVGIKNINVMIEGFGLPFSAFPRKSCLRQIQKIIILSLYWLVLNFFAKRVVVLNPDDAGILLSLACNKRVRHKIFNLNGIGVDLQKYSFTPLPDVEPITFLFSGRLLISKGILTFFKAASEVVSSGRSARFIVVGQLDSSPDSISESDLTKLLMSSPVEYLGQVPSIENCLKDSNVFVLPSYYREGIPATLQESLSVGRPVLTTNLPGCREAVVNGVNGFFVDPYDYRDLARKMSFLVDHPNLLIEMSKASRHIAETKFNVDHKNLLLANLVSD